MAILKGFDKSIKPFSVGDYWIMGTSMTSILSK